MGGFRISISDRQNMAGKLRALSREDFADVVTATAMGIAEDAKDATPVGKVNGGTLVNSIRTEFSGPTSATVGYTAKYAPYVEYGHRQTPGRFVPAIGKRLVASYVPGQHYFKPVVERNRKKFWQRLEDAVSEAMS